MASNGSAGAVDFAYLEDFTAGDRQVISEVLALFQGQADVWVVSLRSADPGWRDVVHTIKGASRGVGANRLADACVRAEKDGEGELAGVRQALSEAVAEIAAYQARG